MKPDELKMVSELDKGRLLVTALYFVQKTQRWAYGSDMYDREGPEAMKLLFSANHLSQASAIDYHLRYLMNSNARIEVDKILTKHRKGV